MAKKKKHKNDVKTDLPIIMDYGKSVFTSFLCFFFLAIPVIVAGNLYLYQ